MKDILYSIKMVVLSSTTLVAAFVAPVLLFELFLGSSNMAYKLFLIASGVMAVVVTGIVVKKVSQIK